MTTVIRRLALILVGTALLFSCGGEGAADNVVTFETADGSTFKVRVEDAGTLERLRDALESGDGRAGIPNGRLAAGDGGVNTGHEWHLVDLEMVDIAIEVCDGTASMVDADLDYWLNTVGRFCSWDARVVAIGSE
ncbi:MAG TPA: hypothetical protein VJR05_08260 [Acidimicrobiia bacterium]|nr:hypothetical protein [Acidimicrobiia bacterium]